MPMRIKMRALEFYLSDRRNCWGWIEDELARHDAVRLGGGDARAEIREVGNKVLVIGRILTWLTLCR
jgi:hypothetical protein